MKTISVSNAHTVTEIEITAATNFEKGLHHVDLSVFTNLCRFTLNVSGMYVTGITSPKLLSVNLENANLTAQQVYKLLKEMLENVSKYETSVEVNLLGNAVGSKSIDIMNTLIDTYSWAFTY